MQAESQFIVLASRSPRRRHLLSELVPNASIEVLPPAKEEEAGFDDLGTLAEIVERVAGIAATKCDDVLGQLSDRRSHSVVVAADTVVVVDDGSRPIVLGQPPEENWRDVTRHWFRRYYRGRTHRVLTGLCVEAASGRSLQTVTTLVTFRDDVERYLDWYLETEEPRGKAGGYAVQGLGSLFVERVDGSLTNVIGLPLRELLETLIALGVMCATVSSAQREGSDAV